MNIKGKIITDKNVNLAKAAVLSIGIPAPGKNKFAICSVRVDVTI